MIQENTQFIRLVQFSQEIGIVEVYSDPQHIDSEHVFTEEEFSNVGILQSLKLNILRSDWIRSAETERFWSFLKVEHPLQKYKVELKPEAIPVELSADEHPYIWVIGRSATEVGDLFNNLRYTLVRT